jgi:molybdenum cofactor cytidylyltransferase
MTPLPPLPPLVLLAAGRSSRMGRPKGLVPVDDGTLVDYQLRRFGAAGGRLVALVVGEHASQYATAVVAPGGIELQIVENPRPELGPFSSIVRGLAALAAPAAFVLPIDCPAASPAAWQSLAAALSAGVEAIVPRRPDGRGGHPVLLGGALLPRLVAMDPEGPTARLDHILRQLESEAPERLRSVPTTDPAIHWNLNSPADLAAWSATRKPHGESD